MAVEILTHHPDAPAFCCVRFANDQDRCAFDVGGSRHASFATQIRIPRRQLFCEAALVDSPSADEWHPIYEGSGRFQGLPGGTVSGAWWAAPGAARWVRFSTVPFGDGNPTAEELSNPAFAPVKLSCRVADRPLRILTTGSPAPAPVPVPDIILSTIAEPMTFSIRLSALFTELDALSRYEIVPMTPVSDAFTARLADGELTIAAVRPTRVGHAGRTFENLQIAAVDAINRRVTNTLRVRVSGATS